MEPTTSLLSFGLSVLANLTTDQIRKLLVSKKFDGEPLRNLFIKSFYKSLQYHKELYDDYAKKIVKKIRAAVKKDELKLLSIISRHTEGLDHFLSSLKSGEFQIKIAEEIVKEYWLKISGKHDLIPGILSDCFSFYRIAFFNLMSEKEGMQAILLECLKIDGIIDILKRIETKIVTRSEFDELKLIAFKNHFTRQPGAQKQLEDYDQYIKNKFRFIELRGFSPKVSGKEIQMELNDIFVPLEIKPDRTVPAEERHVVTKAFHDADSDDKPKKDKPAKTENIIQILLAKNIVILGDPGSGKSTLLKYLAVKAAGYRNEGHPFGCIIPVYFRVSEFANYLKNNGKNLYEFITDHFDKQYSHLFKQGFEYSNLLLFMDGLDEVIETSLRIRVTEQVEDLMARYPYNHYVVASRIVGYQESRLGAGFKHFELQPFGKEEIATFSRQWYQAIAAHTDKDFDHAREQAESLNDSISRNPSVTRLASNPLLMTIIALIHYRGKKLPNKRIELYDISTETFLEHWVNLRMQLRLTESSQLKDKTEIIEIMAPIAFEIHETKSNGLIEEDEFRKAFLKHYISIHTNAPIEKAKTEYKEFLNFLRQEAGFFYEKGENDLGQPLFGFIHLTFEEYFAALHFLERWLEDSIDLKKYVFDPRWVEIIRLASAQIRFAFKGKIGRSKAAEFVKELLEVKDVFPEAYRPLQLVCLVLGDDVSITDELQNEILGRIIDACSSTESEELIASFSRLFKELLYSDGKDVYAERFTSELTSTSNAALRQNLVHILMENSWEKSICKFLTQVLQKPKENAEICQVVFSKRWNDYPIQNLKSFRENFKNYLPSLSLKEDKELLNNIFESFLMVIIKKTWINLDEVGWEYMKAIFDYFYGSDVFEHLFFKLFEMTLFAFLMTNKYTKKWKEFSKNYPGSPLAKNVHHLLKKEKIEKIKIIVKLKKWASPREVELTDFRGILFYIESKRYHKELYFYYYSNDIKQFYHQRLESKEKLLSEKKISDFLDYLRKNLQDKDVEIVKNNVFHVLGPQGNHHKDFERFICAYKSGIFYYILDWLDFPFFHISSNPGVLSKIIAEKSYLYLINFPEKFDLEDFTHEDVCPPARLLAHYLKKVPYDQQLLLDSIKYYRDCPPKEKQGVFAILYKVLNKLE
jgi:hypothetical protein